MGPRTSIPAHSAARVSRRAQSACTYRGRSRNAVAHVVAVVSTPVQRRRGSPARPAPRRARHGHACRGPDAGGARPYTPQCRRYTNSPRRDRDRKRVAPGSPSASGPRPRNHVAGGARWWWVGDCGDGGADTPAATTPLPAAARTPVARHAFLWQYGFSASYWRPPRRRPTHPGAHLPLADASSWPHAPHDACRPTTSPCVCLGVLCVLARNHSPPRPPWSAPHLPVHARDTDGRPRRRLGASAEWHLCVIRGSASLYGRERPPMTKVPRLYEN